MLAREAQAGESEGARQLSFSNGAMSGLPLSFHVQLLTVCKPHPHSLICIPHLSRMINPGAPSFGTCGRFKPRRALPLAGTHTAPLTTRKSWAGLLSLLSSHSRPAGEPCPVLPRDLDDIRTQPPQTSMWVAQSPHPNMSWGGSTCPARTVTAVP